MTAVLRDVASRYGVFSLVTRLTRLGWTRGGSPGIFGVPTCSALCVRARGAYSERALWPELSGECAALVGRPWADVRSTDQGPRRLTFRAGNDHGQTQAARGLGREPPEEYVAPLELLATPALRRSGRVRRVRSLPRAPLPLVPPRWLSGTRTLGRRRPPWAACSGNVAASPARLLPAADVTEEDWLAAGYDAGCMPEYGYGAPNRAERLARDRWAMIVAEG